MSREQRQRLSGQLEPLNGQDVYKIHFGPNDLPPTSAFWSVINYDEKGLLEANGQNRYSLGSNNELKYNADGSLDLDLSNSKPGACARGQFQDIAQDLLA